jgi:ribosomal protein S27AE
MATVSRIDGKMICSSCGVEMNHHCDKVVYGGNSQVAGSPDLQLGGFIEEFHTCPQCGRGASRHA